MKVVLKSKAVPEHVLPLKIRAGSFAAGGLTAGYGVIRDTCQYSKIYLLDLARNEGPQALRVATYYLNPPHSITSNPTKDVFDIDTSKCAVGRSTCVRSLACTFFLAHCLHQVYGIVLLPYIQYQYWACASLLLSTLGP